MKSLLSIDDFGSVDAESDELLINCFTQHPALHEVLNGRRFLVLGRKGSGKTAIYKKVLMTKEPNVFSVGHNFSDYPWHYHDKQVIPAVAEQERYLHSWKYLILLSLSKILLKSDHSQPWSDDALNVLSKIESFVIDTYGTNDPDITEVFHPGKRLRHLKQLQVDLKFLRLGNERDELAMEHLPLVFQDVNRSLTHFVMTALNPSNQYYVCFDQLDISFQPNSPEYKYRLIGLILAARDFATAAREYGKKLKVLVFLRSDIYHNSLLFEDKNKITDTYGIELEWEKMDRNSTLKSLMERRFSQVLEIPEEGAWEKVFDETSQMKGHQTKYQHIIDRTFRRPRDIIKFCNCILNVYKTRRRSNEKFTNEDVNLARQEYSKYLRDEIYDEIYKYYPDFKYYFEILQQIGYQHFTMDNFLDAYKTWKPQLSENISPRDILERLFEFSIIGFYKAGGSGYGGSEYVFKYLNQRTEFNRSADRFRVHWGLIDALGLKQYSRS